MLYNSKANLKLELTIRISPKYSQDLILTKIPNKILPLEVKNN